MEVKPPFLLNRRFKEVEGLRCNMQPNNALAEERIQAFIDDVSVMDLKPSHLMWYQVDVANLVQATNIDHHEVSPASGECLLFLEKSLVWCSPKTGKIQHHPKHLIHCFVDDYRLGERKPGDPLIRGELFSITPQNEQLCWLLESNDEQDLPAIQAKVSNWMTWLNR